MTIDGELVTRKLLLITRELDALREVHGHGVDAYVTSRVDQAVAERLLERVIGRMIDVNYHLLTGSGQPPPSDYHASFVQLGASILPSDFARRLASSAGLRNRIVHEYDDLDPLKVFEALGAALQDVPAYVRHVNAYLDRLMPDA